MGVKGEVSLAQLSDIEKRRWTELGELVARFRVSSYNVLLRSA